MNSPALLALRDLERALPYSLHQLVRKLTIPSRQYPARVIGSQRYLAHKYPADLDVIQQNPNLGPGHIARIARTLGETRKYIVLTDFKMGHDDRFLVRGIACKERPMDAALARRDVSRVIRSGLLEPSLARRWRRAAGKLDSNPGTWRPKLLDLVREKFVLRWTLRELEQGFKVLPKGVTITIEEALRKNPFFKMDVIIRTRGKFVECSFIVGKMFWFRNSYKSEIATQIQSHMSKGNWMKAAKRAWLLGIVDGRRESVEFLKTLAPLFGSRAARLYQRQAEADSVRMLVSMYPRAALKNLTPVLQRIKHASSRSANLQRINRLAEEYLQTTTGTAAPGTAAPLKTRMAELVARTSKRKCLSAAEELMLPPT